MVKRMLVDATHPEETRVVILNGTRLEEFDFETSTKKQLKGNIYLAKVTRVEPSLQAAFVEFGGNRHGFLPFSEIHPDYYQIPVADRMALLAEQERDLKQSAEVDEPVHETAPSDQPAEQPWQPEIVAGEPAALPDENAAPAGEAAQPIDHALPDPGFAADEHLHGDHPPVESVAETQATDTVADDASSLDIPAVPSDLASAEQPDVEIGRAHV